jgi:hypothetical protein
VTLIALLVLDDLILEGRPIRLSWSWSRAYMPILLLTCAYPAERYILFGSEVREHKLSAGQLPSLRAADTVARLLEVQLQVLGVRGAQNLNEAINIAKAQGAGASLMLGSATLYEFQRRVADLVTNARLPAIARRSVRRAAHDVRVGHQPQDREGPRPDDLAVAPAADRSGD